MAGVSAVPRVPASDSAAAAAALRREGVVVVEDLWGRDTIDAVRAEIERQHPEFADTERLHDYLGDKSIRFIAPVTLTDAVRATGILDTLGLETICCAALGQGYVYEAFGMLMVQPGAPAQEPHRDGAILFPDGAIDRVLPASALTVAIPLVDVDWQWAPTAAAPGSHRLEPGSSAAAVIPIEVARGSAAIWDFRTLHAGQANRTNKPRPALYFTACRPFWTDHVNFHATASARLVGDAAVIADLGPRFVRARPIA